MKTLDETATPAPGIEYVSVNDSNKNNISKSSWGETASIYPNKTAHLYDDTTWDTDKKNQLVLCRNYIDVVCKRNANHREASPDLTNAVEKKMAKYHLTDNFSKVITALGSVSAIDDDSKVKYFFMANSATAKHPGLNNTQVLVKSFGPFYDSLSGEKNYYINFYKAS